MYLIPSDGADNLGSVATVMQSDAEQIDAWWRGQDSDERSAQRHRDVPVRDTARHHDRALDAFELAAGPARRNDSSLFQSLQQAGLTSYFTKYLVYYDGPAEEDNVCGQGGSNDSERLDRSRRRLLPLVCRDLDRCSRGPRVPAHDGAVPNGAPHACRGDTSGHTCDIEADLMYPFIGEGALSAKVLDPGRDDYYGHPGA